MIEDGDGHHVVDMRNVERVQVHPGVADLLDVRLLLLVAEAHRRQPADAEALFLQERLADSSSVLGHQQQVGFIEVQTLDQCEGDHRQRVRAGDRYLCGYQDLQPRTEHLPIGEGRKQVTVVPTLVAIALQQVGAVERRTAVELFELALDHLAPVAAKRVWQGLEAIVLVDRVCHQIRGGAGHGAQERVKGGLPRVVVLERAAGRDPPAGPDRGGHRKGGGAQKQFLGHR